MKIKKTIVCKITKPNKSKLESLEREYGQVQKYVQGDTADIYSATKQAMDNYIDWGSVKKDKEYPWYIRNDTFTVEKAKNTEEFNYWTRIPVKGTWGKVTVPIIPHEKIKDEYHIHDSKIVKKDYGFELHLSVSKEVEPVKNYEGAIGVDMGLKKLATDVLLPNRQTHCYGAHVGNIQAKYYFLRRNCSNGYVRRKWDGKDKNKINDICHQISRRIVNIAKKNKAFIVLGKLEGIQNQNTGRKFNRKLHNFPHWKLRQYVKYKAKWEGLEVIEVSEAYTSQRCSRCGEVGNRHKGSFCCPTCNLEVDADKNGAHNIAQRGIGKFIETSPDVRSHVAWLEATTVDQTSMGVNSPQVCEVGGNL